MIPVEVHICPEVFVKALRHMPPKDARLAVEALILGLDTDSFLHAGSVMDDNPIDPAHTADCPRCGRTSYRSAQPDVRVCEYCRGKLP